MSHHFQTTRVWVRLADLQWVQGEVMSSTDRDVNLHLQNGQQITLPRGSPQFVERNPPNMENADNLIGLPQLDEPNILYSLFVRYRQSQIYTLIGPILCAVNPWKELPLYADSTIQQYQNSTGQARPPHIFGIADAAFQSMRKDKRDQSILISGDSGSGKTETTKFVMKFLAVVGGRQVKGPVAIEQQVLQSNPVLEAFGNAKTLRNDNSSRFGKFIEISFEKSGSLCGAAIVTYLLEKSRVVGQSEGERNYHIFYQLTTGGLHDPELTQTLGLGPPQNFEYLRKGNCLKANLIPDEPGFAATQQAMDFIGIQRNERNDIFRMIAAILHLGNLTVSADAEGNAIVDDSPAFRKAAQLLSVDVGDLANCLASRSYRASTDAYSVPQTQSQALEARDALSKAMYRSIFQRLVHRINIALKSEQNVNNRISVLDIFGFEHFQQNRFEQFCINYANEKLQLHFNQYNFALEIEEYKKENIEWSAADFSFVDTSTCLELIEGKQNGILALVDEECIIPKGNDQNFASKILARNSGHINLVKSRNPDRSFGVKHYAAEVMYDVTGFCDKNKDALQPDLVDLLSRSHDPAMQKLLSPQLQVEGGAAAGRKSSIIFQSVTSQFKEQLSVLMGKITGTNPFFVRCLNPNSVKTAGEFTPEMVLDQLRCSGLLEAVRVSRAGFPSRMPHKEFTARFSLLAPHAIMNVRDERTAAIQLIQALQCDPTLFRIGLTKCFLKKKLMDQLQHARDQKLLKHVLKIQTRSRTFAAGRRVRRLIIEKRMRIQAAVALQCKCRRALAHRWFSSMLVQAREEEKRRLMALQQQQMQMHQQHHQPQPQHPQQAPLPIQQHVPVQHSNHLMPMAPAAPVEYQNQHNGNMRSTTQQQRPASHGPIIDFSDDQRAHSELIGLLNSINAAQDIQTLKERATVLSDMLVGHNKQLPEYSASDENTRSRIRRRFDGLEACVGLVRDKIESADKLHRHARAETSHGDDEVIKLRQRVAELERSETLHRRREQGLILREQHVDSMARSLAADIEQQQLHGVPGWAERRARAAELKITQLAEEVRQRDGYIREQDANLVGKEERLRSLEKDLLAARAALYQRDSTDVGPADSQQVSEIMRELHKVQARIGRDSPTTARGPTPRIDALGGDKNLEQRLTQLQQRAQQERNAMESLSRLVRTAAYTAPADAAALTDQINGIKDTIRSEVSSGRAVNHQHLETLEGMVILLERSLNSHARPSSPSKTHLSQPLVRSPPRDHPVSAISAISARGPSQPLAMPRFDAFDHVPTPLSASTYDLRPAGSYDTRQQLKDIPRWHAQPPKPPSAQFGSLPPRAHDTPFYAM